MGVSTVLDLLCSKLLDREITKAMFVEQCARHTVATVGCSRAGIWVFMDTAEGQRLHCLGLYDGVANRMTQPPDEEGSQVEAYFDALRSTGLVVAVDAQTHPATAAFFNKSFRASRVRSLLAVSFSVNGRVFGAFTCTQVEQPVEWSARQIAMVRKIGARASLALANHSRPRMETLPAPLWDAPHR